MSVELSDLKKIVVATEAPAESSLDAQGRAYATGRRKTAAARLWLKQGSGRIFVNKKEQKEYFPQESLRHHFLQPLKIVGAEDRFDVMCTVAGSGFSAQAGAVRHALARALCLFRPDFRPPLKKAGFLTRDSREVERKKPGQPGARKRFQFSKR